jgi:hypothetical protein
MRCSIILLFTYVLVLSCPVGKGECTCEKLIVGANSKILGGSRQTRKIHVERTSKRFSLTRGRGYDGCFREVPQEGSHSSMYKVYNT